MDQSPCSGQSTDHRRDDAPFCDERNRYLRHCAERGAAPVVIKVKRNELLWIAGRLGPVTEGLFLWTVGLGAVIGVAIWIGVRVS